MQSECAGECNLNSGPKRCGHVRASASTSKNGAKYPYYHCTKAGCRVRISTSVAEGQFLELLHTVRPKRDMRALFVAIIKDVWRDRQKMLEKEIEGLRKQVVEARTYRDRLTEKYVDSKIPDDIYQEHIDRKSEELEELSMLIRDKEREDLDIESVLQAALNVLQNSSTLWLNANLAQRQRVQHAIFPDGIPVSEDGKVGTPVTSKVFSILQSSEVDEYDLATPTGLEPVLPA